MSSWTLLGLKNNEVAKPVKQVKWTTNILDILRTGFCVNAALNPSKICWDTVVEKTSHCCNYEDGEMQRVSQKAVWQVCGEKTWALGGPYHLAVVVLLQPGRPLPVRHSLGLLGIPSPTYWSHYFLHPRGACWKCFVRLFINGVTKFSSGFMEVLSICRWERKPDPWQ